MDKSCTSHLDFDFFCPSCVCVYVCGMIETLANDYLNIRKMESYIYIYTELKKKKPNYYCYVY